MQQKWHSNEQLCTKEGRQTKPRIRHCSAPTTIGWQKDISSKKRYCCYTLPKIKQNSLSIVACVQIGVYKYIHADKCWSNSAYICVCVCASYVMYTHAQWMLVKLLNLQEYFAELHTNEFFRSWSFSVDAKVVGKIFQGKEDEWTKVQYAETFQF